MLGYTTQVRVESPFNSLLVGIKACTANRSEKTHVLSRTHGRSHEQRWGVNILKGQAPYKLFKKFKLSGTHF